MRWLSLKTKMTVMVSLLLAVFLSFLAFLATRYFEKEFRNTIARHQLSMLSALAHEIDGKIAAAQGNMISVARKFDPSLLTDAVAAERFLRNQANLLPTFDNGLYLFAADGTLLAGTAMEKHMRGRDYSFRAYFRATARTGQGQISKPFRSSQGHGHPVVMFTMPVLDERGQMLAMLAGSLDLLGENFLGQLTRATIGTGGYFYLFASDGTLLIHPEPGRILHQEVAADLRRLAAPGEGVGETINFAGQPVFSSCKSLLAADWVLAADYPLAAALAPVKKARHYFFAGLVPIIASSVLIVWLFMRHLTAPLLRMTGHVRALTERKTEPLPIAIATHDEIGILAGAFNRLTEESAQQKRIIEEQKDFAVDLLENAAAPIFVLDADHRVLIWNRACAELTGVTAAEVKGTDQHWRGFYEHRRPCLADFVLDDRLHELSTFYDVQDRSQLVENGLCAEGWLTLRHNRKRYLIFSAAPVRNRAGTVVAAIETLEDITARKQAEGQMEFLAHFDPLTGLPNRLLFFDHLTRGIADAERYGHGIALLFLDLDGFKAVNDTLGHDAGDRVLGEVAERLKGCMRTGDTVARMGGDEFTILLNRVGTAAEARLVVARIQQAFAAPFLLQGKNFIVGASIGISLYPMHGRGVDTLVKKADSAMYLAKAEGVNRYRFAEEEAALQAAG